MGDHEERVKSLFQKPVSCVNFDPKGCQLVLCYGEAEKEVLLKAMTLQLNILVSSVFSVTQNFSRIQPSKSRTSQPA